MAISFTIADIFTTEDYLDLNFSAPHIFSSHKKRVEKVHTPDEIKVHLRIIGTNHATEWFTTAHLSRLDLQNLAILRVLVVH